MVILGVDASTKCTGWCILDGDAVKDYGKIVPEDVSAPWRERILYMMREIGVIARHNNIDLIACEVPVKTIKNVNTLEQLFSLHGALLGVASLLGIRFCPVEVATWRKHFGLLNDIPAKEKDKRSILKERSIKLANEMYNLDLKYISPSSGKNDDDISDSMLIATYTKDILATK